MSPTYQNTYKVFDRYCVRTPLFQFSYYKDVFHASGFKVAKFKKLLLDPIFREATFLASPDLYGQIVKWEQGDITDPKKIEKLYFSILKYATRISTRCTPFGLFAACAIGSFDTTTQIKLRAAKNYQRHTRFDTTFLTQLYQALLKEEKIRKHLLLYPNTSIYKIGDQYRYVEYTIQKKKRTYTLEGIKYAAYLETILNKAKSGTTSKELSLLLVSNDITTEEAQAFIEELIEHQVLVSALEVTVTGTPYFKSLVQNIKKIPEAAAIYKQLFNLQLPLIQLDKKFGNGIHAYKAILLEAKKLVPDVNEKHLLQTDTFASFEKNTLDKTLKRKLHKAFVLFNKMSVPSASAPIEQFKRDFLKRFHQSEVPLNFVLDTETGIGFGEKKEDTNDLIDNLPFSAPKKRYERVIWTDTDTVLQRKLIAATQQNAYVIELKIADFKELPITCTDLPDTFSSIIEIYKSDNKEHIFIQNIGGASATYLLGRFAYGTAKLQDAIAEIVAVENSIHSDKILAEIVHLPEARTGNILQRTAFRNYEIPYLGKSSVPEEFQIPIEDLLVSIKNDRIILRSKKLKKEILPHLSNAHNFGASALPIYQFLCSIKTQNERSSIGFSWNAIFEKHAFLPRVTFENMILSKARWKIEVPEFKNKCQEENLLATIQLWQKEHKIPDLIALVEGDNKLLIDLNSEISVQLLLSTVRNKNEFIVEEFLFSEDEIIKNKEGLSFCNQFIVSFYNDTKLKASKNEN
jgi:hypothetical protein